MTPRRADDRSNRRRSPRQEDLGRSEFADGDFDDPRDEYLDTGEFDDDQDDPREEDIEAGDDDEPGAYCPECGAGVFELANRCPDCGRDITPASRPPWRFARSIFLPLSLVLLVTAALVIPMAGFVCR